MPLLRDDAGYSAAQAGLHGTLLAAGAVTSGLLQARYVRRFGRWAALWVGCAGVVVGTVVLCAGPALPVTLLGAYVAGAGGGLLLNAVTAVLTEHQGAAGPAAITETNALAAGLGVLAPLAVGLGAALGVGWRPALLVVVPYGLALWLFLRRTPVPPPRGASGSGPGELPARLPRPYWIMWVALACFVGVEFCTTLWGADLVRARTAASPAAASAAVAAFLGGFLVGRLVGSRLVTRLDPSTVLLGSLVTSLLGFGLLWTSTSYVVAVAGLLVLGLGVAVLFPLGLARAVQLSGGLVDLATGRSGLGVGLASGVFPLLLGALADRSGVPTAFLVVPAVIVVGAVCVTLTRHAGVTLPG